MSTHLVPASSAQSVIANLWRINRKPQGLAEASPDWTFTFTPDLTAPELVTFTLILAEAAAAARLSALSSHLNPDGSIADAAVIPPPLPVLVTKLNPDGSIADPAVIAPILPAIAPAIVPFVFPPGIIVMWAGLLTAIPAGWKLCDGTLGTPDLRGKFIKGAAIGALGGGATGGSSTHTHAAHTGVISHTHPLISKITATGTGLTYELGTADATSTGGQEGVSTAVPVGAVASLTHDSPNSEPPWFALCFLMKT